MLKPYWPRAIILVDMNAFFAAVEQRDDPELRGRPVGITNGAQEPASSPVPTRRALSGLRPACV